MILIESITGGGIYISIIHQVYTETQPENMIIDFNSVQNYNTASFKPRLFIIKSKYPVIERDVYFAIHFCLLIKADKKHFCTIHISHRKINNRSSSDEENVGNPLGLHVMVEDLRAIIVS